jgi:hypothetical protein
MTPDQLAEGTALNLKIGAMTRQIAKLSAATAPVIYVEQGSHRLEIKLTHVQEGDIIARIIAKSETNLTSLQGQFDAL